MHKMRVAIVVNVALMGSLMFMNTGCRTAAGGWRWPWQEDRATMNINDPDLIDPELISDSDMVSIFGEDGELVSGARFEDTFDKVNDISFDVVYFTYDSYILPPNEIAKVDQIGQHMNSTPNHVLVIEGNCDERGSNEYNLSLGENRALAIRSYLINMGVSSDRIQTRSFGEENPAVMGMDESAWRMNRRGEFSLFQK